MSPNATDQFAWRRLLVAAVPHFEYENMSGNPFDRNQSANLHNLQIYSWHVVLNICDNQGRSIHYSYLSLQLY